MEPATDRISYTKTEATLGGIGVVYGFLLTIVLRGMLSKFDTESLSHRFRYLVLLIGTMFVRMLCSFIGVGEAQYAQNDPNSILPFFLFDVGDLMFVVSIIAKSGAQIRNFLSFEMLVKEGIVYREARRQDDFGFHELPNERNIATYEGDSYLRNLPYPRFLQKILGVDNARRTANIVDSIGGYVFSCVLAISVLYTVMSAVLYRYFEHGVKRHSAEQIFLIIVYSLTFLVSAFTTYAEKTSGSLSMVDPREISNHGRQGINAPNNFDDEQVPQHAFSLSPSQYEKRQKYVSWAFGLFLLLRIGYSVYQIKGEIANEFKNEYWLLIIEYGVKMAILTLVFYLLLSPMEDEEETLKEGKQVIHGSYDRRDPYFIFRLTRKFCATGSSTVEISARIRGIRRTFRTHITQILHLMSTTAGPIESQQVHPEDETEEEPEPEADTRNRQLRNALDRIPNHLTRIVREEGNGMRNALNQLAEQVARQNNEAGQDTAPNN
eukprot:gb/GECG01005347.1/.p1 GENE.gb/GECG01005347.1/~~gb/GECG01005347.1/.p1  ORF type:complete len:493 (+),score=39.87 gb/GECG01005347.1/:1-1479(+)